MGRGRELELTERKDSRQHSILKERFPTFGTVITVADNTQDDVEIDSD